MSDTTDRSTSPNGGAAQAGSGEIAPGTRIGDYLVTETLARGGFGTVYRVEHALLGRPAALKLLHAELASSDEALARFELEARAVNRIGHPNVIDIHDFGRLPDSRPYYIMELLAGTDLERALRAHGRLPLDEALDILAPLCDALAAAHDKGIIHRDIKASNVFLSERDGRRRVILLDFGVAKLIDPVQQAGITTSRHAVGTPTSMAPEQIVGGPVDARTDVYALAALVYHLIVGEPPFPGQSSTITQYMHMHARRPRAGAKVGVPMAVDDVLVRAMSIAPAERHAGPRELLAALRAAASETTGRTAPTPTTPGRALAVHIDVRVAPASLEDPDEALLADLEGVLPLAGGFHRARGFAAAMEAGNSLLMTVLLPDDRAEDATTRAQAVSAARELDAALVARPGRDARVHVNLVLHAGRVLIAGEKVKGGELMRLSAWVPDVNLDGVAGTAEALAGLDLATDPVAGGDGLLRILP
jgi:eukaryotic-like serine/threonine-protein kinase